MKLRYLYIALVVVLGLGFVSPVVLPVQAAPSETPSESCSNPDEWKIDLNFRLSPHGFSVANMSGIVPNPPGTHWAAGEGWRAPFSGSGGQTVIRRALVAPQYGRDLAITYVYMEFSHSLADLPEGQITFPHFAINSTSFSVNRFPTSPGVNSLTDNDIVWFDGSHTHGYVEHHWYGSTDGYYTQSGPAGDLEYTHLRYYFGGTSTWWGGRTHTLHRLIICGIWVNPDPPQYYHPIPSVQAYQIWPAYWGDASALDSRSYEDRELVHSATDGGVYWEHLTFDDCVNAGLNYEGGVIRRCYINGDFYFNIDGVYKLLLIGDDGSEWLYWVDRPFLYTPVRPGGYVQAGCPVGGTLDIRSADGVFVDLFPQFVSQPLGGFVPVWGLINADVDAMTLDPPGGDCETPDVEYDGCVVGSGIDAEVWDITGEFETRNGDTIVRLVDPDAMQTLLNVDAERDPRLRFYAYSANNFRLAVTYGDKIYDVWRLSSHDFWEIDIDLSEANPDVGPFYTLRIATLPTPGSPSGYSVYIGYLCLYLDNIAPPEFCYFANYDFRNGLTGWTVSDSSVIATDANSVIIPDDESILQQLALFTNEFNDAIDYNVRIQWGVRDYSAPLPSTHYFIGLEYKWGGYTDNEFVEVGFATPVRIADTGNNIITAFNLSVSQNIDADFELRIVHSTEDAPPSTLNAEIRSVCITSDTWPQGGPVGPFDPNCPLGVQRPAGSDVGLWTNYLWSELNRFFRCDLMVMLNNIYQSAERFYQTTTHFFRWVIIVVNLTMNWLTRDVLFWMNGHLANIASGSITTIYVADGGGCNNIFCAFDSLLSVIGSLVSLPDLIIGILPELTDSFVQIIDVMSPIIISGIENMTDVLIAGIEAFSAIITSAFDNLAIILTSLFDNIGSIFVSAIESLASVLNTLIDNLGSLFLSIVENIIVPVLNAVIEILLSIFYFIRDALTRILDGVFGFIGTIISLIATEFITAIWNFIAGLIERLLTIVSQYINLFIRFVDGIVNAEPIPITGLPYCSTDPESSPLCRIVWVIENTVLASPGGSLIVPIVTSWISVLIALWVLRSIKTRIGEFGRAT